MVGALMGNTPPGGGAVSAVHEASDVIARKWRVFAAEGRSGAPEYFAWLFAEALDEAGLLASDASPEEAPKG